METLIWPTINLSILIGILTFVLKKPLRNFVSSRHDTIKKDVGEVREELRSAQSRFDDFSSKLQAVESESQSIRSNALEQAEKMKVNAINNAKELSSTIIVNAKNSSQNMTVSLMSELRREFANELISASEAKVTKSLTGDLKKKFNQAFSAEVKS